MTRTHGQGILCGAVLPLLVMVAIAFALLAVAPAGAAAPVSQRTCFPAKHWDAEQAYRPCARVTRVYEDGSITVAVSDHNGTVRYTATLGALDR